MYKWHAVGGNIVVVGWVVGDVAAVRRMVVPVAVFFMDSRLATMTGPFTDLSKPGHFLNKN